MSKVLKTMGKDDSLTIRVNDDSDSIIIAMESQSMHFNSTLNIHSFVLV
jgi:hypothetical protein